MKTKKKLFFSMIIVGLLALVTTGVWVLGAQKPRDVVHNRLTLPFPKGEIEETFEEGQPITVGAEQEKNITIKNTGNASFFVRVLVFPEITNPSVTDGYLPANINDEIIVDLGADWVAGEDGYYYYLGQVDAGASTTPLFTKVALSNLLDTAYDGAEFSIQVKSEIVTAANHQYRKVWWDIALDTAPVKPSWAIVDAALDTIVTTS